MRATWLLGVCGVVAAGCKGGGAEGERPRVKAAEAQPAATASPPARPTPSAAVASFDAARAIVDPYADVEGDVEDPVYPGWPELRPRLEALLGPATFEERSRSGSTRYFWAFVDGPECHYFTFWVNEAGEGHGGVEIGHETSPPERREIDAHAECVGWASGKRVGVLYQTE